MSTPEKRGAIQEQQTLAAAVSRSLDENVAGCLDIKKTTMTDPLPALYRVCCDGQSIGMPLPIENGD